MPTGTSAHKASTDGQQAQQAPEACPTESALAVTGAGATLVFLECAGDTNQSEASVPLLQYTVSLSLGTEEQHVKIHLSI